MPALEKRIRKEADKAKRDDSLLAGFKALRLNLGTDDTAQATLLDAGTWRRITGDAPREGRAVWGLDLGQSEAMAGCAAFWPATGRLEALASFPNEPGLAERGVQDGVGNLYVRMFQRAELVTTGGEATDIAEFLKLCRERFGLPSAISRRPMAGLASFGTSLRRLRFPVVPFHEPRSRIPGWRRGCPHLPACLCRGRGDTGAELAIDRGYGRSASRGRSGRQLEAREVHPGRTAAPGEG